MAMIGTLLVHCVISMTALQHRGTITYNISNSVNDTKFILHQVAGILVPSDLIAPPNPMQNIVTKLLR